MPFTPSISILTSPETFYFDPTDQRTIKGTRCGSTGNSHSMYLNPLLLFFCRLFPFFLFLLLLSTAFLLPSLLSPLFFFFFFPITLILASLLSYPCPILFTHFTPHSSHSLSFLFFTSSHSHSPQFPELFSPSLPPRSTRCLHRKRIQ